MKLGAADSGFELTVAADFSTAPTPLIAAPPGMRKVATVKTDLPNACPGLVAHVGGVEHCEVAVSRLE